MRSALAEDFSRLPDVEVVTLQDDRLPSYQLEECVVQGIANSDEERDAVRRNSAECDWTVLIAPELDGRLQDRCRWVDAAGGRLLSPGADVVRLASDKHCTALFLADAGIPTPYGVLQPAREGLPADFPYPAVLKRNDGAGSQGLQFVQRPEDTWENGLGRCMMRIERWHPGMAASAALLCGPGRAMPLPACGQHLSKDGRMRYLGGWTPLSEPFSERVRQLASRVGQRLPPTIGYLGIDVILGDDGPSSDLVVEVNPRLTTSYLGLRRLARTNLAEAMLQAASGREVELSFESHCVEFSA
jgi:predicted ATP-grasp superfamily ATP-dependent carboligase